jgi:hypothetical protein
MPKNAPKTAAETEKGFGPGLRAPYRDLKARKEALAARERALEKESEAQRARAEELVRVERDLAGRASELDATEERLRAGPTASNASSRAAARRPRRHWRAPRSWTPGSWR